MLARSVRRSRAVHAARLSTFFESSRNAAPGAAQLAKFALERGLEAPRVAITSLRGRGLGLRATEDISRGALVLRVPEQLWSPFSAETAREQAKALAPDFYESVRSCAGLYEGDGAEGAQGLTSGVCLAMHLLFGVSDEGNPGTPYLQMLPQVLDMPLHWRAEELALLQGTDAEHAVAMRKNLVSTLHRQLFGPAGTAQVSLPAFAWSLSTVLARALHGDSLPFSCVPVLDLLNHAHTPNVEHAFDAPTRSFVVRAVREVAVGEELLTSYGELPSAALLRQYGFVEPGNPHERVDAVPLLSPESDRPDPRTPDAARAAELAAAASEAAREAEDLVRRARETRAAGDAGEAARLEETAREMAEEAARGATLPFGNGLPDPLREAKLAALDTRGLLDAPGFPCYREGLHEDAVQFIAIAALASAEATALPDWASRDLARHPASDAHAEAMAMGVFETIETRLAQYPSRLEEDEATLAELEAAVATVIDHEPGASEDAAAAEQRRSQARRLMAFRLRVEEQRLLHAAMDVYAAGDAEESSADGGRGRL